MLKDIRPGIFGITDRVKLIDFGYLIGDKLNNDEIIQKQRNKYKAPESLQYLIEELCYDVWSFGCLIIDIFSKEEPIFRLNLSLEEVYKLHNMNIFPNIPNDINGLLKDIVTRCLDRNHEKRIKIEELVLNMKIFFENYNTRINALT
jgi:serine/threonine protein kinase